ncbi:MAG: ATP-binding protein [Actinomycetota bacterium]|nr:ATP-binding protein [Actinomycetota bacterium]
MAEHLTLAPDASAVATARGLVSDLCKQIGLNADARDTAVLLTSETVTNAFTHGRSEARIFVTVSLERIRVEVGDDNSRHPHQVSRDHGALDGRGMTIVGILATNWGVTDDPYGKVVWFEVAATSR